jgi:uncharacterized protein (DUF2461 family)
MKIVNNCISNGYQQYGHEDKLKKAPKGFPDDFKYIEALKFKHYLFSINYEDKEAESPGFINHVIDDFTGLYPLVYYLNNAMDLMGNE